MGENNKNIKEIITITAIISGVALLFDITEHPIMAGE